MQQGLLGMNLPVGEGQRELERRTPQISPFALGSELTWCPALRLLLFLLLRWEEVFDYEITGEGGNHLFLPRRPTGRTHPSPHIPFWCLMT